MTGGGAFPEQTGRMRAAVLVASFLLLLPVTLDACCDFVILDGHSFFRGSTATFVGRWAGGGAFHVEKVFHGDLVAHTAFPAEPDDCQVLTKDVAYVVTRNWESGHCDVKWFPAEDAKPLLAFLETMHGETLATVLGQVARWHDGTLSHGAFRRWLEGVLIRQESSDRDTLLKTLDELRSMTVVLETIETCDSARARVLFERDIKPLRDASANDLLEGLRRSVINERGPLHAISDACGR